MKIAPAVLVLSLISVLAPSADAKSFSKEDAVSWAQTSRNESKQLHKDVDFAYRMNVNSAWMRHGVRAEEKFLADANPLFLNLMKAIEDLVKTQETQIDCVKALKGAVTQEEFLACKAPTVVVKATARTIALSLQAHYNSNPGYIAKFKKIDTIQFQIRAIIKTVDGAVKRLKT